MPIDSQNTKKSIVVDCISDLHGNYPLLEGGDLLIVAGDLTKIDTKREYDDFCNWIQRLPYKKIVIIGGNHDNFIQYPDETGFAYWQGWSSYLCDSGTEFQGFKIWGSPWTQWFHGVNPKCKAFMLNSEKELSKKWAMIPDDIDILVTHSPAYGIKDQAKRPKSQFGYECVGSKSLQMELATRLRPRLHVFGHIHEAFGIDAPTGDNRIRVNASYVNEKYDAVNSPIRIEL